MQHLVSQRFVAESYFAIEDEKRVLEISFQRQGDFAGLTNAEFGTDDRRKTAGGRTLSKHLAENDDNLALRKLYFGQGCIVIKQWIGALMFVRKSHPELQAVQSTGITFGSFFGMRKDRKSVV